MKLLVACECTATVREAFKKRGWNAWSCDLQPSEIPGQHFLGDVRLILNHHWDLIIAHPPCTYLCNSANGHLYTDDFQTWTKEEFAAYLQGVKKPKDKKRWQNLKDGVDFFNLFLNHPCKHICIENPIMTGHAYKMLARPHTQVIQPYEYGHGETKTTWLWLKGLPPLKPTNEVTGREHRIHNLGGGSSYERSRTYQGIADAMAQQWTTYLKSKCSTSHDSTTNPTVSLS